MECIESFVYAMLAPAFLKFESVTAVSFIVNLFITIWQKGLA